MADDLTGLEAAELDAGLQLVKARMRPVEEELASLRGERDVILTELRRRERLEHRQKRVGAREAARSGEVPTVADLVSGSEPGAAADGLDAYAYTLKTGGEVRLGFPGARAQSLTFTDGRQVAQARDLVEAARLYALGWELGSPGRPGVRVHFPGTRQERLIDPTEVFARSR